MADQRSSDDQHTGAPTRLSQGYEELYDKLLRQIGARWDAMPDRVCVHWPMRESTYSGRLLVVGQALNAWMVDGPTTSLNDPSKRAALLAATREVSESASAWDWMRPMPWSRPFWRLARIAMDKLGLELRDIAWSNLAKVAPATGGNPDRHLLGAQHDLGGQLLKREIDELNPALVLVISRRGYLEPFLASAQLAPLWSSDGARQFDGTLDGRRWIVVKHPGTFASSFNASKAAVLEAFGVPRPA